MEKLCLRFYVIKFLTVVCLMLFVSSAYGESVYLLKNVNARSGPSTSYKAISWPLKGTVFQKIKTQDNWVQVRLADNRRAWIAKSLTRKHYTAVAKNTCHAADSGAKFVGGFGAAIGVGVAKALCCGVTVGWGCVVCIGGIGLGGAVGGAKVGEYAGELTCN